MDRGYYLGQQFQNIWRDVVRREKWSRLVWQMRYAPYFSNKSYGFENRSANDPYHSDFPYLRYEDESMYSPVEEFENFSQTIPIYQVKCDVPLKPDSKWYEIAPSADQRWTHICPQYKAAKIQPKELTFNPTTEIRHKAHLNGKPADTDRNEFPNSLCCGDFKYKNLMLSPPRYRCKESDTYVNASGTLNLSQSYDFPTKADPVSFNRMTYLATHPRDYNLEMMQKYSFEDFPPSCLACKGYP